MFPVSGILPVAGEAQGPLLLGDASLSTAEYFSMPS